MTPEPTMTVMVPRTFADDHQSRDLPSGVFVRSNRRYAEFRVTAAELAAWRSDAGYYTRVVGRFDYRNNRAVCDSAHRTLCALPERFEADR